MILNVVQHCDCCQICNGFTRGPQSNKISAFSSREGPEQGVRGTLSHSCGDAVDCHDPCVRSELASSKRDYQNVSAQIKPSFREIDSLKALVINMHFR